MKKVTIAGRDFTVTDNADLLDKLGRKRPICTSEDGYLFYSLTINGKSYSVYVSRLMWMIHKGEIPEDKVVDHIDENKQNNHIDNLQLLGRGENVAKSKAKEYFLISPEGVGVKVINLHKFCRDNKLDNGNLTAVIMGRAKSHKGWRKYG